MKRFSCSIVLLTVIFAAAFAQKSALTNADVNKLVEATAKINALYVDTVNGKKQIENAIVGMLTKLDPHSVYIPEKEVKEMNEPLVGNFEGIGVQFQMIDDSLFVDNVISGGPSEKVGILPGDRIVMVEDSLIAGVKMTSTAIVKKLRGKKGTVVRVKIYRRGVPELIEFRITRDKIPLYSVDAAYMIAPEIGYIKLNKFSATTMEEFTTAMNKLRKEGMKDLIFDLQSNGGGFLNAATQIANDVLGNNKLIVYTEGREGRRNYKASSNGSFENGRIVILINEYSASASEILAGAVQDWDRGVIVGRRSYGKGLVQQPVMLGDGSMMRLTTARYYTPSGRCIQRPYKDGVEKYNTDMMDRFRHGEFVSADSIHFSDSLKYETLVLKRTVYGGGGIMPDCFVPLDTTYNTKFLTQIIAKGIISNFVSKYSEANMTQWKANYPSIETFNAEFNLTEAMFTELIQMIKNEKVTFTNEEFEKSKSYLAIQIKALFARRIWDNQAFYQVINHENDPCQKALEILQSDEMYKSFLTAKE